MRAGPTTASSRSEYGLVLAKDIALQAGSLIAIQCHMANVWAARKVIVFAEVAASPQIGLVAMYQIPAVFELCRTTVLL